MVESDIKKHARLNMIAHLLSTHPVRGRAAASRSNCPTAWFSSSTYERPPRELSTYVPDHVASLLGDPERSD